MIGAGATFSVELGSTQGGTDIGVLDAGSALSYVARDVRAGTVYARVRARLADVTSQPSNEVTASAFSLRQFIEALYFGTGFLGPADGNRGGCAVNGRLRGFSRGQGVAVLLGSTIPQERIPAIRSLLDSAAIATRGATSVTIVPTNDVDPQPRTGQVSTSLVDVLPCNTTATGCAILTPNSGATTSSRAFQLSRASNLTYAHELGHAVLGLCHVEATRIGGGDKSLMSSSGLPLDKVTLSPFDISAIQAVYDAGLGPGATRDDLARAGLID
ncbi:MAG: hypothetical protein HOP16_08880 [Acidobacteria bacterium]|nr:hypothetical protein [Acidobacteriota bacterium]